MSPEGPGEDEQVEAEQYRSPEAPAKQYKYSAARPKAFMVEDAQWERIQRRVDRLEKQRGINWLLTAASTVAGIGASALLALLVLPHATTKQTELAAGVRPTLWAVGIGGLVLGVLLVATYFAMHSQREKQTADICDEMDTIHAAWKERRD